MNNKCNMFILSLLAIKLYRFFLAFFVRFWKQMQCIVSQPLPFLVLQNAYLVAKIQIYIGLEQTGRQVCVRNYPGRCPGLGAFAVSGRVGKTCESSVTLLLYDFFSCRLPANKAGIEFYYLIAVLCQYSCGIFASLAASAVHGDSLAFGKSGSGLLLEV